MPVELGVTLAEGVAVAVAEDVGTCDGVSVIDCDVDGEHARFRPFSWMAPYLAASATHVAPPSVDATRPSARASVVVGTFVSVITPTHETGADAETVRRK